MVLYSSSKQILRCQYPKYRYLNVIEDTNPRSLEIRDLYGVCSIEESVVYSKERGRKYTCGSFVEGWVFFGGMGEELMLSMCKLELIDPARLDSGHVLIT